MKQKQAKFLTIEREIGGTNHKFNFKHDAATEAQSKLELMITEGNLDAEKIRDDLKQYIYTPAAKPSVKAPEPKKTAKAPKVAKEKKATTRGRGDTNELKDKIVNYFTAEHEKGTAKADLIKNAMKKFDRTYANVYYYFDRVWSGNKKKWPVAAEK